MVLSFAQVVAPRKRRVSRNVDTGDSTHAFDVAPRKRRVSRNPGDTFDVETNFMSRLARGV